MSSSYKVGWSEKTVSGSLDPLGDRMKQSVELYEKMLLDGLKVFLAEVKFSGARMVVKDGSSPCMNGDPCVRITMPKGELGLGWNHTRRKWVAEVVPKNPVRRRYCFYSKSVELMEERVRKLYNELK